MHIDAGVTTTAIGVIASAALFGALGVSIGALIRNQTAACAAVLVWLLAIEGIISDIFHRSAFVLWLPIAVAHTMISTGSTNGGPSAPVATAFFTGYVAAFAVAATRITLQRDVT